MAPLPFSVFVNDKISLTGIEVPESDGDQEEGVLLSVNTSIEKNKYCYTPGAPNAIGDKSFK